MPGGQTLSLVSSRRGESVHGKVTMGETADRLSVLAGKQAELEIQKFEEPLQDYLKQNHAVKLALQRRHEKRLTYSTCLADVESKQASLSKLRSQLDRKRKRIPSK